MSSIINNAVARVNEHWRRQSEAIQDQYRGYARRRQARYDAMDDERDVLRNRLKAVKPEGARPTRFRAANTQMAANGYTRPSMVGGNGYVPRGVTALDNTPVPTMRRVASIPG